MSIKAAMDASLNAQNIIRLLRAIRAIQLVQRSNAPKSAVGKACEQSLKPLMREYSTLLAGQDKPYRADPVIRQGPQTEDVIAMGEGQDRVPGGGQ